MKYILLIITLFSSISVWATNAVAEIELTNEIAKDIGKTYGFYLSQNYLLDQISTKYPSLSNLTTIAKKEFSANYISSINNMNALMAKNSPKEWDRIKNTLNRQIAFSIDINKISKSQANQFVNIVRQRAKGNINSPIIETLLLFNPKYQNSPEYEFLNNYKYKYTNEGTVKAKGVAFSIEIPKTWTAEEGNRPNVVQKFVSENGNGLELLLIVILEMPLPENETITAKDIKELLNPEDIKSFLPPNSTYLKSGSITLENLPGLWVQFKRKSARVRTDISMEAIMYTIFYKNKMIQIHGQVTTYVNGIEINRNNFNKHEKLFDLIVNSFVLPETYQ